LLRNLLTKQIALKAQCMPSSVSAWEEVLLCVEPHAHKTLFDFERNAIDITNLTRRDSKFLVQALSEAMFWYIDANPSFNPRLLETVSAVVLQKCLMHRRSRRDKLQREIAKKADKKPSWLYSCLCGTKKASDQLSEFKFKFDLPMKKKRQQEAEVEDEEFMKRGVNVEDIQNSFMLCEEGIRYKGENGERKEEFYALRQQWRPPKLKVIEQDAYQLLRNSRVAGNRAHLTGEQGEAALYEISTQPIALDSHKVKEKCEELEHQRAELQVELDSLIAKAKELGLTSVLDDYSKQFNETEPAPEPCSESEVEKQSSQDSEVVAIPVKKKKARQVAFETE